ncbi:uncharacterized protein BJ171DRAFT_624307 [Polychytrium aggregatum]|uniref:uncharacterized protein n=1 Tax=Polychytrium aggregatum TaxID=110093 RepID=UPI0022FF12C7|nr:uncharacterized protein BJ171DRAFT_624307 [Polychytrium aggregatum]KAI9203296.1 hypothetical protein BJ171DRAFT_624307 [Polychytrium aggregatum]
MAQYAPVTQPRTYDLWPKTQPASAAVLSPQTQSAPVGSPAQYASVVANMPAPPGPALDTEIASAVGRFLPAKDTVERSKSISSPRTEKIQSPSSANLKIASHSHYRPHSALIETPYLPGYYHIPYQPVMTIHPSVSPSGLSYLPEGSVPWIDSKGYMSPYPAPHYSPALAAAPGSRADSTYSIYPLVGKHPVYMSVAPPGAAGLEFKEGDIVLVASKTSPASPRSAAMIVSPRFADGHLPSPKPGEYLLQLFEDLKFIIATPRDMVPFNPKSSSSPSPHEAGSLGIDRALEYINTGILPEGFSSSSAKAAAAAAPNHPLSLGRRTVYPAAKAGVAVASSKATFEASVPVPGVAKNNTSINTSTSTPVGVAATHTANANGSTAAPAASQPKSASLKRGAGASSGGTAKRTRSTWALDKAIYSIGDDEELRKMGIAMSDDSDDDDLGHSLALSATSRRSAPQPSTESGRVLARKSDGVSKSEPESRARAASAVSAELSAETLVGGSGTQSGPMSAATGELRRPRRCPGALSLESHAPAEKEHVSVESMTSNGSSAAHKSEASAAGSKPAKRLTRSTNVPPPLVISTSPAATSSSDYPTPVTATCSKRTRTNSQSSLGSPLQTTTPTSARPQRQSALHQHARLSASPSVPSATSDYSSIGSTVPSTDGRDDVGDTTPSYMRKRAKPTNTSPKKISFTSTISSLSGGLGTRAASVDRNSQGLSRLGGESSSDLPKSESRFCSNTSNGLSPLELYRDSCLIDEATGSLLCAEKRRLLLQDIKSKISDMQKQYNHIRSQRDAGKIGRRAAQGRTLKQRQNWAQGLTRIVQESHDARSEDDAFYSSPQEYAKRQKLMIHCDCCV